MGSWSELIRKFFNRDADDTEVPTRLEDIGAGIAEGSWDIQYRESDGSLIVTGKVDEQSAAVYLMFNRKLLGIAVPSAGAFRFLVQKAKKKFAPGSTFQLATPAGVVQHVSGVTSWPIFDYLISDTDKFLDLDACIARNMRLTKKGSLVPHTITPVKKNRYCKLVRELDAWFEAHWNYPVLVSHGTLLGITRGGDLVPYDDDFDCLYLSRHTDIRSVIEERTQIAAGLLRAGFVCRLGRTGHIKVRTKYVEVDLMPAWITDDTLYVSSYSEIPAASEFIQPPRTIKWGSHGVFRTFAKPELFLQAQYGPNWRTPDPGYRVTMSPSRIRNRKLLLPSPEAMQTLKRVREELQESPADTRACGVMQSEQQGVNEIPASTLEGSWEARVQAGRDLVVYGRAENTDGPAYLMFNGRLLGVSELRSGAFKFVVQGAFGRLKPGSAFQVVMHAGTVPHASGTSAWQVDERFAAQSDKVLDLDQQLDQGMRLTKKGTLVADRVPEAVKQCYFDTVRKADEWFSRQRQYPVLVSHGTLLGLCRGGDLIPHDDDFDCLYLSRQPDARAVAAERRDIVREMSAAGFSLAVGATGHIKLRAGRNIVDLMPAWISNDTLYISSYSEIPAASSFVEPPGEVQWNPFGTLRTFARPERFLEAQYGPGWRTPDPGYRLVMSESGRRNRKLLKRSPEEESTPGGKPSSVQGG